MALLAHIHGFSRQLPRYYHRSLNISKLVDVKFTYVPRNMTLARMIRLHKLPDAPHFSRHACLREMEENDLPEVTALFKRYMQRFDMAPELTMDDARHQFLSGRGEPEGTEPETNRRKGQVVWSYVVEVGSPLVFIRHCEHTSLV